MAGQINVLKSPELLAAIAALQAVDRTFAAAIRKYTKVMAEPEWKRAVASRSSTTLERRVISGTTTVAVSNANVRVRSAGKGRPLSGGLTMAQAGPAVEFRSNRYKQFGGPRRRKGPFYESVAEMTPRLASLWFQTIIKTTALALEGKQT